MRSPPLPPRQGCPEGVGLSRCAFRLRARPDRIRPEAGRGGAEAGGPDPGPQADDSQREDQTTQDPGPTRVIFGPVLETPVFVTRMSRRAPPVRGESGSRCTRAASVRRSGWLEGQNRLKNAWRPLVDAIWGRMVHDTVVNKLRPREGRQPSGPVAAWATSGSGEMALRGGRSAQLASARIAVHEEVDADRSNGAGHVCRPFGRDRRLGADRRHQDRRPSTKTPGCRCPAPP